MRHVRAKMMTVFVNWKEDGSGRSLGIYVEDMNNEDEGEGILFSVLRSANHKETATNQLPTPLTHSLALFRTTFAIEPYPAQPSLLR